MVEWAWCYSNHSNGSAAVDEDPLAEFTYLVNGPGTSLLVVVGLVCISVSLGVLLRARRRPLIYLYLIGLEMWNAVLLSSAFLLYSLPNLIYGKHAVNGPYAYSYLYSYVASNMSLVGSVWTILALSVDRYAALCHPLRHKAVTSRGLVIKIILGVSALACLFTVPRFFELQIERCHIPSPPFPQMVYIGTSKMRSSTVYHILYKIVGGLLCYSLAPFVAILLLTVRIAVEMRKSWLKRRTMSTKVKSRNGSSSDNASNVMLVAVTVKFLLSHTMPTLLDLAELIAGQTVFSRSHVASLFVTISSLLLVINASSNIWIYLIWGPRFRRELQCLLLRRQLPGQSFDGSTTTLMRSGEHHLGGALLSTVMRDGSTRRPTCSRTSSATSRFSHLNSRCSHPDSRSPQRPRCDSSPAKTHFRQKVDSPAILSPTPPWMDSPSLLSPLSPMRTCVSESTIASPRRSPSLLSRHFATFFQSSREVYV